ncbi:MAG: TetR/AcrR family transcriptional regulator [Polyangiales bacterium]
MDDVLNPVQLRSILTQQSLLMASAKRLVRDGLAAYTTSAVATEAGMSQGALYKHFPTKSLLLANSVRHLLYQLFQDFDKAMLPHWPQLARKPLKKRVSVTIAALWKVFRSNELRAVFEVFVAARTDRTLDELLGPILEKHRAKIHERSKWLFAELADHEDGPLAVDAIVFAMQGAAIGLFGSALRDDAANLAFFERLALREMTLLQQTK